MTRSASSTSLRTDFRLGLAGTASGWACSSPRALAVSTTGASSVSARRRSDASADFAPPPARITGRVASAASPAALAISPASGAGGAALASCGDRPSADSVMTSVGISIWTGPGRAPAKSAKASASAPGSSSGLAMRRDDSATFSIMPRWSGSSCRWPKPLPSVAVALTPEITSIGTESARACPMAVIVLVRPGPVMTKATPGFPEARA